MGFDRDSKLCAEFEALVGPGEPCGAATASAPRTGCLAGGTCPMSDGGVRNCVARLAENQACGSTAPAGAECVFGTTCTNGVCKLVPVPTCP